MSHVEAGLPRDPCPTTQQKKPRPGSSPSAVSHRRIARQGSAVTGPPCTARVELHFSAHHHPLAPPGTNRPSHTARRIGRGDGLAYPGALISFRPLKARALVIDQRILRQGSSPSDARAARLRVSVGCRRTARAAELCLFCCFVERTSDSRETGSSGWTMRPKVVEMTTDSRETGSSG